MLDLIKAPHHEQRISYAVGFARCPLFPFWGSILLLNLPFPTDQKHRTNNAKTNFVPSFQLTPTAMTNLERLQTIGIKRLGTPKRGFRYQSQNGRLTQADLQRIDELKIPPAWTDVAINPAVTEGYR